MSELGNVRVTRWLKPLRKNRVTLLDDRPTDVM